jgi:hypothetical protein
VKKAKNLFLRLDGRALIIEIDISEDDLIRTMISSLAVFINEGFPIKVNYNYMSKQPLSKLQSMFIRVLRNLTELEDWANDIKRLLHIQRTRL